MRVKHRAYRPPLSFGGLNRCEMLRRVEEEFIRISVDIGQAIDTGNASVAVVADQPACLSIAGRHCVGDHLQAAQTRQRRPVNRHLRSCQGANLSIVHPSPWRV